MAAEARFGLPVVVHAVEPLGGGAHRTMQRVDVDVGGEARRWVLCRVQPGASGLDPQIEHDLLVVMADIGVPVPAAQFALTPADGLGAGYVMEWVEGETIARRILSDPSLAPGRAALVDHCGQALARIHGVDPDRLPALPAPSPATPIVEQRAARWRALLDRAGQPLPALEVAVRWLETHAPPVREPRLVHGDFRLGNLLVGPDGLRAVLDWELASLGDPMEDLGWLCTRAWRWGNDGSPSAASAPASSCSPPTRRRAGRRWTLTPCAIGRWPDASSGRSAACSKSAGFWTDPSPPSRWPPSAARSASRRYDALTLIDGDRPLGPLGVVPDTGPATNQQAPSAEELTEAVASWLAGPVSDSAAGGRRFEARIAANLVRVLGREARLGAAAEAADRRELGYLLGAGAPPPSLGAELARRVRAGEMALDDRLIGAGRRLLARQLLIANPDYLGRLSGSAGPPCYAVGDVGP